ncbi:MAG TPA: NFACT RNA binding domain-containing protein [Candidatus Baltobacteraceae bacterium]|nr:NFACT RNA binding domain-containing protein [Candidatus Baltobacteraceae bacterium]
MRTDWLLIRRLAWELEQRFAGARVTDVGRLEDGRFAIALWKRGTTRLVCVDAFAPTPLITVEDGDLPIAAEPGFVRAAGAALRGMTLTGVRSRRNDRLIRFDFGTRSRFGVEDSYSLICELVPRFGNVVLVKGEIVVAAAQEFAPAENAVRAVQAGQIYEPPPLRKGPATLLPDGAAEPLGDPERAPAGDLFVYRRNGTLIAAHLAPLPDLADIEPERAASLLDLFAETRRTETGGKERDRLAKRRRELERTLAQRERKLHGELAQLDARLAEIADRERLRDAGEAIYATLHELAPDAQTEAKARAAELFAKYRKAETAREHTMRRRETVLQAIEDLAALGWSLEAAADADVDDVAEAIAGLEPKRKRAAAAPRRKRKPLQFETANGSRILVGRTPIENADLTFRIARPDDLWFHVQNQPGAHVILQRDDRAQPPEADLLAAAALAAMHSKAKTSPKVTVDYTKRKYVRKRPSAAPGLVFYTNPKSLFVSPDRPAGLR